MTTERNFLHDISSPLTNIQLTLENVISMLEDRKPEEIDECIKMMQACLTQMRRASDMVRVRRETLIKGSEK